MANKRIYDLDDFSALAGTYVAIDADGNVEAVKYPVSRIFDKTSNDTDDITEGDNKFISQTELDKLTSLNGIKVATKTDRNNYTEAQRQIGLIFTYFDTEWKTERYQGTDVTDINWQDDTNWVSIDGALDVHTNSIYVDKTGNDTTGSGTTESPYLSIAQAISVSSAGDSIYVNPGEYTENITLTSGVHLIAHGATLIGTLSIGEGSSVYLFKHLSNGNSQAMLTKSGTAVSYYKTIISDGRGDTGSRETVTNILNQTNSSILFVDVETLYVTTTGRGVRDFAASFGHIHFKIKDLYLAGNFCIGLDAAGSSSDLVGYVDHILEINSPSSTTGLSVASGSSITVTTNEVAADTAYNVNASGEMFLNCGKIVGTKTGANSFNTDVIEEGTTNLFLKTTQQDIDGDKDFQNEVSVAERSKSGINSIAYALSVTVNFESGDIHKIGTLTGNITVNTSNVEDGQTGVIQLVVDSTGGYTVASGTGTWKKYDDSAYDFADCNAASTKYHIFYLIVDSIIFYSIQAAT